MEANMVPKWLPNGPWKAPKTHLGGFRAAFGIPGGSWWPKADFAAMFDILWFIRAVIIQK